MGTEESQGAKGVDIGQDMVPLFSEHMGGEAEKRWTNLHAQGLSEGGWCSCAATRLRRRNCLEAAP